MNVPAKEARANFSKLLESAAHSETPVIITKQGDPYVAVVSIERLNYLQSLEDEHDANEVERILSDPTTEYIPYEQARAELGL